MFKKVLAFLLALSLWLTCFTLGASADGGSEASEDVFAEDFAENEFIKCAENSLYELYVIGEGERKGEFYIKNKAENTCFYSNPQDRDFNALSDVDKESSQFLLQLYSGESGAVRTLNSFKGTAKGKYITVKTSENGFTAQYKVNNIVNITLKFSLTDNGFTVESNFSKINASKDNFVTSLQLFPYFFASQYGEEGYSLVPDGSGALIYNNTNKNTAGTYSQKLYGTDLAFASFTKTVNTQAASMPVFGAKNTSGGFIAVIDKGSANATVNAVSAYNSSMYNRVYSSFDIVGSDKVTLGESGSGFTSSVESYDPDTPLTDEVKVSYMFISKNENYSQMAKLYREHIGLTQGDVSEIPSVFLELYGGLSRKESILGIPFTVFKKLTTVEQAGQIVSYFEDSVGGQPVVSYRNIDSAVISGKLQNKFRLKGSLGSKKELTELKEALNGNLFIENNIFSAKKGGNGFSKFSGIALRMNRNSITLDRYDLSTTGIDTDKKSSYAVKTSVLNKVYKKYFTSVEKAGFDSAFINLANTAYSDFDKKNYVSRQQTVDTFTEMLSSYGENGMLYTPNAYAFSYGKYIVDTPISSSGYDIIDVDIPFYQMVLSGVKEYSTVSLNLNTNTEETLLKAIESGASLKFTFVYGNITAIKNTEYEYLFGADFEKRKEQARDYQKELEEVFSKLGSRTVKNHTVLENGIRVTEYENGSKAVINYSDTAVKTEYGTVEANSYITVAG